MSRHGYINPLHTLSWHSIPTYHYRLIYHQLTFSCTSSSLHTHLLAFAMACIEIRAITAAAVAILLLTAPYAANAVTCGDVATSVAPCMAYARTGQGSPSAGCCSGIKSLNLKAVTGTDRQTVCNCLKNLAKTMTFNSGAVAGLPGKCGVSIPYAISTSTDCSKVH
ncbi:Non-specific lipid-transfer protein [Rhynchospora pubera]|uniref:Non-specific lipid-transfer protein n=1 Tax=Rhynchospora pubera TaxID=906938 RepID=A0AAV8AP04_9POAL|nr:Non-specific lipid-transfer protein [Rhynchospora pubera]KAJ4784665.1 Non-specific lipid-transfer protein [Rhynchospora pubera]KAJ4803005.1 Non-specific lipid-transfer protein [Rhynchospora pubera]